MPSFKPRSPMTKRCGMPINSMSANITPGRSSRSSSSTSIPAACSVAYNFSTALRTASLLPMPIGTMAPFQIAIVPIGMGKSEAVRNAVEKLYATLQAAGIDVLLDDRDERPGVMFADMELIGNPHRLVIGERGLKDGMLEYQGRRDAAAQAIPLQNALEFVESRV